MVLSQPGYRSFSSARLAALSSAWAYSSAMLRGMFFFCTPSNPADMILDTNGCPYSRVACTTFFFGRYSVISTPYFAAISLTCRLVACISSPVLKKQ